MLVNKQNSIAGLNTLDAVKGKLKLPTSKLSTSGGGFAQALASIQKSTETSKSQLASNIITSPLDDLTKNEGEGFTPISEGNGHLTLLNKSGNYYVDKERLLTQALKFNGTLDPEGTAQKIVLEEQHQRNQDLADGIGVIVKILSPLTTLAQAVMKNANDAPPIEHPAQYANLEIKKAVSSFNVDRVTSPKNNEVASSHQVAKNDTLIRILRKQAQNMDYQLTPSQEMRLALQTAQSNDIADPNKIYPGQIIDLRIANQQIDALQQKEILTEKSKSSNGGINTMTTHAIARPISIEKEDNPVLTRTLDRAVIKGYIPPQEKELVYNSVIKLAKNHQFEPDDFARITLMESDGMNPRASNERCHGIIQFCDGPNRGAASVGYSDKPRAILNMSVNEQLGLVDKYFTEVGLKNKGSAGLEDLYLSVLKPTARDQTANNVDLQISGQQAKVLYTGPNGQGAITRESIRSGLIQHSQTVLARSSISPEIFQTLKVAKY